MCGAHDSETNTQDKIDILESILDKDTFKVLKVECNKDKESMVSLAVTAIEKALNEAKGNQLDDESMFEELDNMDDNSRRLLILKIPCMLMTLIEDSCVYLDLTIYCHNDGALMSLFVIQAIKNELEIFSKEVSE